MKTNSSCLEPSLADVLWARATNALRKRTRNPRDPFVHLHPTLRQHPLMKTGAVNIPLVREALLLGNLLLAGQVRRNTGAPALMHSMNLAYASFKNNPDDSIAMALRLLHDAIEDACHTNPKYTAPKVRSMIRATLGLVCRHSALIVEEAVWMMTRPPGRSERAHVRASYNNHDDHPALRFMVLNAKCDDIADNADDIDLRLQNNIGMTAKWLAEKIEMLPVLRGASTAHLARASSALKQGYEALEKSLAHDEKKRTGVAAILQQRGLLPLAQQKQILDTYALSSPYDREPAEAHLFSWVMHAQKARQPRSRHPLILSSQPPFSW